MKLLKTLVLFTAVMSSFCGSSKIAKGYVDSTPDEINQLITKKYSTSVHAVGTAGGPDEMIAINKATMQARAEIARQFKAEVEVLQKDYQEAMMDNLSGEYNEVMEAFSALELNGSQIVKAMVRKDRADYFSAKVLVVVSAGQLKQIIDQKMRDYTSYKATNAYKELENRVEKERSLQKE
jgi:hypothetical protein